MTLSVEHRVAANQEILMDTREEADERPRAPRAVRFTREAIGERLGGFIYGTIIVLAVVVAGARTYPDDAGRIAALAGISSLVLWFAHVYAHGLAGSVAHDRRLSAAELRYVARREGSIVEAALPPIAALLLGAFGVVPTEVAVWLAIGLGLVVLAIQGITFAHVERMGWVGTFLVVAANVGLGVVLVGLKLLLTH
jgi:hypothetical protein